MLKIFNTLSKKKEIFKPINKNKVNLYVCGVTVYDFCHIGHGRTFIAFDIIVRYLRLCGFSVKYVRNITDIDDKIILKSIKEKINITTLTNKMINAMHKDFSLLGMISPDEEPRVTNYIDDIIKIIMELINKQHAYVNENGDVFFSINSCHSYGILSGQSLQSLQHGCRIALNNTKKNPLDFLLWKSAKNNECFWNSPWGKGRPGWHIECSAINNVFFKNSIDIHGGGCDLIFPHHENERSQSICLNNKLIVNYWMHTGVVITNNQKMSKSLNNIALLRKVLQNYHAEVLRYFFLSTHYRHPIYYSEKNLQQAYVSLKYLYTSLYHTNPLSNIEEGMNFEFEFYHAMNDDFNTPKVLSIFSKIANNINYFKEKNILKANKLAFRLQSLGKFLGFFSQIPEDFLQKKYMIEESMFKTIEKLVQKRNIARKSKLWKEADDIRKKLISLDVIVEDFPDKTIWRKK